MLSTTLILFLLSKFSSVHGCPTTCGSVTIKFTRTTEAGGNCECTGRKCVDSSSGTSLSVSSGPASENEPECRDYCCKNCEDGERNYDDDDRRILQQDEFENTLSVSSEESTNTISLASDPVCFCYGVEPIEDCSHDTATSFDECSEQCNSFCHVDFGVGTDGELEDCQASPLFIDEHETIDENIAKNYISELQESGTPGKVCVCELKGFMIGASNISDFEEQNCDKFCSQGDSFGGVRSWLTTDEKITTLPTSSPSASPTSTSSRLPTWAVAFFSSVVCVGFIMITLLFCKTKPGSSSG